MSLEPTFCIGLSFALQQNISALAIVLVLSACAHEHANAHIATSQARCAQVVCACSNYEHQVLCVNHRMLNMMGDAC